MIKPRSSIGAGIITGTLALALAGCTTPEPQYRAVSGPFVVTQSDALAPLGGDVSSDIVNYSRAAPHVGISGALNGDGVAEAKELGFRLIIDLRQASENGVEANAAAARQLGVKRVHLPFASDETAWEQISVLEKAFADTSNYPILLHCGSANRAAAAWALYRSRAGVDPITALEEAFALGLTSRESFVRERLAITG